MAPRQARATHGTASRSQPVSAGLGWPAGSAACGRSRYACGVRCDGQRGHGRGESSTCDPGGQRDGRNGRMLHRAKPARALHIGAIVPAGWRGRKVEVRKMAVGRPKAVGSDLLSPAQMRERREAKGLSMRALALRVGMSAMALSRYEADTQAITDEVARRILSALEF